MALSQNGANYKNQSELQRRDRISGAALDDLASQIAAVREQGNFGQTGNPVAPNPPGALTVSAAAGFVTAVISDKTAAPGTNYLLQYATTPNFVTPVPADLGTELTFHAYLQGLTLYFRCAARFLSSPLSGWTYYGPASNPTSITP